MKRGGPATSDSAPVVSALSVVIPCFNEAENVEPCYQEIVTELADHDLELIYVDDGSTDATLERVKGLCDRDPRVHYLSFTRNFGFEAAFSAGYRYAQQPWILHLDADQQFPAAQARLLIRAADAGYDAVFGIRIDRRDPLLRRCGAALFDLVARRVLRIELPRGATAFRLVRSDLAREIVQLRLGTPYFLATVPLLTSRYTVVPVTHRPRTRGRSKVGLRFLAIHAIGLCVAFSPRLTSVAALAALLLAVLAAGVAVPAATGLIGVGAGLALGFLLASTLLLLGSLVVRYLVAVAAGHARPRMYYIRETDLPVEAAELLCARPEAGPRVRPSLEGSPVAAR